MAKDDPREIHEKLCDLDIYDVAEGSIREIISYLQTLPNQYPNHRDLYLKNDLDYYYDCELEITLHGTRDETPEEVEKRLVKAKKAAQTKKNRKKKKELEEQERLKKLIEKYPEKAREYSDELT